MSQPTTSEEVMYAALKLIDRTGCTNFTSGRCWDDGRTRGAQYGADAWCDACVAADALEDIEWCTTPDCVRPMISHPDGMHLTENGHEFPDQPVRHAPLKVVR
ncbi:MAG: hypothetical protein ACREQ5_00355 [Candidatus Dormibacteria bacterium]